ncbi:hypothetical protein D9M73_291650 [compost metagenome]
MRDQAGFLSDEPEFVLGVPLQECLIDLPDVAQIDVEGPGEIGDVPEGEHILGIGGTDRGKHGRGLAFRQRADFGDLGAVSKFREGRADE